MQLIQIDAGNFTCDGGSIFGSVPKVLWSRQVSPDAFNMITVPMRCLLIITDNKRILIETGAGEKHHEKFIRNNGLANKNKLINSIEKNGFPCNTITDVILTHLHWDHVGGATYLDGSGLLKPTFPNATHHIAKAQWDNALSPNRREADAYFKDDFIPLMKAGLINLIEDNTTITTGLHLQIFNGHTPGQLIPFIDYKGLTIVYVSDLIPTSANIPTKWIAAYDLFPVTTMEEKELFLKEAATKKYVLFFEHDYNYECAIVIWDKIKGPKLLQAGKLSDFICPKTRP